ncbi:YdcF family protein [Phormidium tenue FACHB-886]|nr:YdcF family protein [Phormidium tenue FACHB-886]
MFHDWLTNPNLCPSDTAGSWADLTGWVTQWIVEPFLVLPLVVVLFNLLGSVPRRYGRRFLKLALCVSTLIYLIALFPPTVAFAEKVLIKQIPRDTGTSADAVVILGRGDALTPSRVEVAAKLWQEHRAPLVFASGIWDAPKMIQRLHAKGIPDQALDGEGCSRTTYENAKFTAEILKPLGIKRILLVTDAPHMLRSRLTFQKFGFTVIPIASASQDSLDRSDRAKLVLHEYAGLVMYSLKGRLTAPALPQISVWLGSR